MWRNLVNYLIHTDLRNATDLILNLLFLMILLWKRWIGIPNSRNHGVFSWSEQMVCGKISPITSAWKGISESSILKGKIFRLLPKPSLRNVEIFVGANPLYIVPSGLTFLRKERKNHSQYSCKANCWICGQELLRSGLAAPFSLFFFF